jgi:hypothetical protein
MHQARIGDPGRSEIDLNNFALFISFDFGAASCNSSKSDQLAAAKFLDYWVERNQQYGSDLENELGAQGMVCDLLTSARVTFWAYSRVDVAGGLTWRSKKRRVRLPEGWEQRLLELIAETE